jgi:two-component system OmpR family response regulator
MRFDHSPKSPPVILVVDDLESLRLMITRALLRAGYHVLTAANYAQAIRLIDQLGVQPQAAVIDLHLPAVSGDELTAELRRRVPDLPLLFVSAGGHDQDELLPGLLLEKPFSLKTLCYLVGNLLTLRAQGVAVRTT